MFQLGNYPFLSVVLPCVLNICLWQKLLWVLFHCLSLPLFSPHTSQGTNTTRFLPKALPFHSNFTTLHMMETGMFLVIIHLLEISTHGQSKKKKKIQKIQCSIQRKNVCLINARCLVLSVEVTLLPIQREKMLIGTVVCFSLWFIADVGMLQGSFSFFKISLSWKRLIVFHWSPTVSVFPPKQNKSSCSNISWKSLAPLKLGLSTHPRDLRSFRVIWGEEESGSLYRLMRAMGHSPEEYSGACIWYHVNFRGTQTLWNPFIASLKLIYSYWFVNRSILHWVCKTWAQMFYRYTCDQIICFLAI